MAETAFRTQVERRAELVDRILEILGPQLEREPIVTVAQHIELQAAIAHFADDRRGAGQEN
jgi:hypothetical protein